MHPFKYLQYHIGLSMELQCTAFFTVLITTNGSSLPEAARTMKHLWRQQKEKSLRRVVYILLSGLD